MSETQQVAAAPRGKLVARFAERYGVDGNKMMDTLRDTAFQAKEGVSNSQMMALLIVADQYDLNPFTKELYAYPDKNKGIVPIVSVDGWTRIVNSNPNYDGAEFTYSDNMVNGGEEHPPCPEWVECVMYRKDRARPVIIREYFDECYKKPFKNNKTGYITNGPWQSHPKRFLRHKTWIQCARMAFGFAGIYDRDEAANFVDLSEYHDGHTFDQTEQRGKPETAEPQSKSQATQDQTVADAEVVEDAQVEAMQAEEVAAANAQAEPPVEATEAVVLMDVSDQLAITNEAIASGLSVSDLERHFGLTMDAMPMNMHAPIMEWLAGHKEARAEAQAEQDKASE